MKKILLPLTLVLFSFLCTAQTWNWADAYVNHTGTNNSNYIKSLKLDTSGNLVMSGYLGGDTTVIGNDSLLFNGLISISAVAKFSNSGNPIWAKDIRSRTGNLYAAVDPTDNGIYISSSFMDSLTLGGTTVYASTGEYFIARMDSNGNFLWLRNFGQDQADWINPVNSRIATDADGNVYFGGKCGFQAFFATDTLAGSNGVIFIVKYDKQGNEQWVKQLGQNGAPVIYELVVDDSKNIFITGTITGGTTSFDSYTIPTPNGRSNSYLVKLDSNATVAWAELGGAVVPFNIPGQIYPATIGGAIAVNGDNVYWTGGFGDTVVFGGNTYGPACGNPYCFNYFLANYDQQGNFKWFKHGEGTTPWSMGDDIETDGDGHVYVSGEFNYSITLDGISLTTPINFSTFGQGDRFVAKYDTSGVCQWMTNLGTPSDAADMTVSCSYPNIFIAGNYGDNSGTFSSLGMPTPGWGEDNIFLAAINNSMNCPPPVVTSVPKVSARANGLSVFPNPSSDRITIELPKAIDAQGCTVSIFNSMGQLMSDKKISSRSEAVDVSNYAPGIYSIRVTDRSGKKIGATTVVKE